MPIESIEKIVVAPGPSTESQVLALALLLAETGVDCEGPVVFRRQPSEKDYRNPVVAVVGGGAATTPGRSDPDNYNYATTTSTSTYLAQVAEAVGITDVEWMSHVDDTAVYPGSLTGVVSRYRDSEPLPRFLTETLMAMGTDLIMTIKRRTRRLVELPNNVTHILVNKVWVLVVDIDREESPTLAVEQYCRQCYPDVGVVITADVSGGWSMYRRNDDPAVDFSGLADDLAITFAHPKGFIAKTVAGLPLSDAVEFVRCSISWAEVILDRADNALASTANSTAAYLQWLRGLYSVPLSLLESQLSTLAAVSEEDSTSDADARQLLKWLAQIWPECQRCVAAESRN